MIDFLSSWAEQVIVAVVIASILEMILPENKTKKYVKMVIGIYILFNIISPVIDEKDLLNLDTFTLESYATTDASIQTQEVNQASMDERLQELYVQELENNIKTKVEQEGYKVSSCKVDAILSGDEVKQGINKITLVVSENSDKTENNENEDDKSNVQSINKVEINVGLDKYINVKEEENDNKATQKEIQNLKKILSDYYEVDTNKINISIK